MNCKKGKRVQQQWLTIEHACLKAMPMTKAKIVATLQEPSCSSQGP